MPVRSCRLTAKRRASGSGNWGARDSVSAYAARLIDIRACSCPLQTEVAQNQLAFYLMAEFAARVSVAWPRKGGRPEPEPPDRPFAQNGSTEDPGARYCQCVGHRCGKAPV